MANRAFIHFDVINIAPDKSRTVSLNLRQDIIPKERRFMQQSYIRI